MNFVSLQDEVLTNRFDPGQRPQAKNWINYRYGRLWGMENWSFKYQVTTLNVTSGATSIARGTIGDIVRIWDTTVSPGYAPMVPLRPEDMWDAGRQTTTGAPYDYTIVGTNIYFERPMDTTRSFYVLSTLPFTTLVNDTDIPLIPTEYHYLLVAGATAMGQARENDPSSTTMEQEWQNGITDMKATYLTSLRTAQDSYPDWP